MAAALTATAQPDDADADAGQNAPKGNIVELPLTLHTDGYERFEIAAGGISTNKSFEGRTGDPWAATRPKASDLTLPEGLSVVEWGEIETDIYQSTYLHRLAGKISSGFYETIKQNWQWAPDSTQLSKTPMRTSIAFAVGRNAAGERIMVVDANDNLDLTDDARFTPPVDPAWDSALHRHFRNVSVDVFRGGKIVPLTIPLFIEYDTYESDLMYNFPVYATADLGGERLVVANEYFTNLSFCDICLAKAREGKRYSDDEIHCKGNHIEIG